jgi:hypothetical protein
MALTDRDNFHNVQRPVLVPQPEPDSGGGTTIPTAIPHASLARLPLLHAEAAQNALLGRFVARSVTAAGLLMLAGGAVLLAGGGTLSSDFAWSLLVLAGIAAMAVNYIRGPARSLRRTSLQASADDLRAILFYTGFAWGAGAFLALPADPSAALVFAFALGPVLLMLALLQDEGGIAAFTAPIAGLTAAAGFSQHWSDGPLVAPVVLAAAVAVIVFSYIHSGRLQLQPGGDPA